VKVVDIYLHFGEELLNVIFFKFFLVLIQLLGVQLCQPHSMELDKVAQEQQQNITILFVYFPALLDLMPLVHH